MQGWIAAGFPEFTRIIIDEFQDAVEGVLSRRETWRKLAEELTRYFMQIIILTGTIPPSFVRYYHHLLGRPDFTIYRQPSDRHNVSLHYIPAHRRATISYAHEDVCLRLIKNLQNLPPVSLKHQPGQDRILVFFPSTDLVQNFGKRNSFLWYHSKEGSKLALQEVLQLWDEGPCKVLIASTAMAQGLDRKDVRWVIVVDMHYGISLLAQMMGRAGRDDIPSATYFIGSSAKINAQDVGVFDESKTCHRKIMMNFLDGLRFSYTCLDAPHPVTLCGNCDPNSESHRIGLDAVAGAKEAERLATEHLAKRAAMLNKAPTAGPSNVATSVNRPKAPSTSIALLDAAPKPLKSQDSVGSAHYWDEDSIEITAEMESVLQSAEGQSKSGRSGKRKVFSLAM